MSKTPFHRFVAWAVVPALLALGGTVWAQGQGKSAVHKPQVHKAAARKAAARPSGTARKPAAVQGNAAAGLSAGGLKPSVAQGAAGAPAPVRAAASSEPVMGDYIVAVVNTEPITNNELRARMARAERELSQTSAPPIPPSELRKQVLDQLITERAELQFARENGITVSDDALQQAEMTIARQNNLDTIDELHRRMAQEGIALKDFEDDLRNQVMLSELRAREIEPKVKVSSAEVEQFVREQNGGQTAPPEINLGMILVAVPENAAADEVAHLKARADDIAAKLRDGGDFTALARQYSDANNHGRDGGELGLRSVDQYPALFVGATQSAKVGDIVGPIRSAAGFHILKVLQRQQAGAPADVKVQLTDVRHILLKVDAQQSERVARERLADIRQRIESGKASFEDMAREYSQDPSASQGGELGWVPPGQFVPEFEQAMNNLRVGQISEPIVTRFGVHLIQVEDRREQVLTADQQRELARNILREKKTQEQFEAWARDVRGRAYVEYRDPPQAAQ